MKRYIIGVDEVGRGALAGPIVVAAVLIKKGAKFRTQGLKLKDSKKLSSRQREAWFLYFKDYPEADFVVSRVYPRGIERMNVSRAANLAALRAYRKLVADRGQRAAKAHVFLDGGLFLGNCRKDLSTRFARRGRAIAKTIVRGDEKIPAVAIASIIAKVSRDRAMARLAGRYPAYGFEIHKGYGTRAHYRALKKHGPCAIHRLTFLQKRH